MSLCLRLSVLSIPLLWRFCGGAKDVAVAALSSATISISERERTMDNKKLGVILESLAIAIDQKDLEIYLLKLENERLKEKIAEGEKSHE